MGETPPPALGKLLDELRRVDTLQDDLAEAQRLHVGARNKLLNRGREQVVATGEDLDPLNVEDALTFPPLELNVASVAVSLQRHVFKSQHGHGLVLVALEKLDQNLGKKTEDSHFVIGIEGDEK